MGYKHLTREQRYTIEALLQTPMSLREIGEVIGVSTGTVSREIRRNSTGMATIGTDGNWLKRSTKGE